MTVYGPEERDAAGEYWCRRGLSANREDWRTNVKPTLQRQAGRYGVLLLQGIEEMRPLVLAVAPNERQVFIDAFVIKFRHAMRAARKPSL